MTAEKAKTAYETLISSLDKLLPNKFGLQLLIVQLAESYAKQQLKERDELLEEARALLVTLLENVTTDEECTLIERFLYKFHQLLKP